MHMQLGPYIRSQALPVCRKASCVIPGKIPGGAAVEFLVISWGTAYYSLSYTVQLAGWVFAMMADATTPRFL